MPKQNEKQNHTTSNRKSTQNQKDQARDPREMTIEERLRALRQQTVELASEPAAEPAREEARPARKKSAKQEKPEKKEKKEKQPKQEKQDKAEKQEKSRRGRPAKSAKQEKEPKAAAKNSGKNASQPARAAEPAGNRTETKAKGGRKPVRKTPVRIIPLGGLNEIGKNITVYECGQDAFLVDCGMGFPDADMLGVDLVIPDFTYLEKNKDKIRGLVITHGHEDHIGSIPYLLKRINVPIYGTRLTIGLLEGKLKEHGLLGKADLRVITPRQSVKMGCMSVEFIRVNHSIPDAVGVAIHTPAGVIVYTGDFKVDFSPIEGEIIDLARFAELGSKGVLCLLSDSTNAERPGATPSESKVGQSFNTLFNQAEGKRIIVATFSSNIHRIQQIVDYAMKYGRKVAVSGRSMINAVTKALELGYLHAPDGVFIDIDEINRYPSDQVVLVTTGSQGEPLSALSRMASSEHRKVSVTANDFIIISANPIPGNEKHVTRVVNDLLKLGAEVIYEKMYEVHVSGHACQDELKLILSLTKPKYFIPFHGEYKHLVAHGRLAHSVGIPESNILIADIGQVIQLDNVEMKVVGTVEAGGVFVDGLGVGDVGSIVIRDRKRLAQDGLIIIVATIAADSGLCMAGPDIVSRGFVYVRESEELMEEAREVVKRALDQCLDSGVRDWTTMKNEIKDALSSFIYRKTKRSPMILPIMMEV